MRRAGLVCVLVLLAPLVLGADRPRGLEDVEGVRHWSYPEFSRVSIELSGNAAEVRVNRLPADPAAGRPERLYVDLEGVWVGARYNAHPIPVGDGLLEGVRLGQNTLTATRVVIDLERYERHRIVRIGRPERVVIDVFGRRPASRARSAGERRPEPSPALAPPEPLPESLPAPPPPTQAEESAAAEKLPMDLRPVRTVVLDAGHGGRDPGALGLFGLREKDVTLRLAKAVRRRLEARGLRVVMTRDADRSLDLEDRTAIAEGSGGDLFVSLHLNAAESASLHGVETYYLDESYERHSITVAARENGVSRREVDDLQKVVARLRVTEASGRSATLAGLVHQQILGGMRRRYGAVEDLGVRRGPFYVLYLSSMPSILIEAGFITNREDARRLRDPKHLSLLADEIAEGLLRYRDVAGPVVARSLP